MPSRPTLRGLRARPPADTRSKRARASAALSCAGALVVIASFFFLPWEAAEGYYSNAGHELSVDAADGPEEDYVQGYLVAATLLAAGLGLVPLALSLATGGRPLALSGVVAAIAAVAWIAFSGAFIANFWDEIEMGFGIPVAWAGGALIALGAASTFRSAGQA